MVHYRIIIFTLALLLPYEFKAAVVPSDLPTIEALISLHKTIKAQEDAAKAQLAASYGEQSLITKTTAKVRNVKEALNSKMDNMYSYVLLASTLSTTSLSLYKLIDDYGTFVTDVGRTVASKPFVAWYFTQAQTAVAREIKLIQKLVVKLTASQINILKSSMDEKLRLLLTVQAHIDQSRHIIHNANMYCTLLTDTSWRPDYFYEIINSQMTKDIATEIISKWRSGK